MSGTIPTALVALTLEDAERLCDMLNARLGLDREAWAVLARRAMRPEGPQTTLMPVVRERVRSGRIRS